MMKKIIVSLFVFSVVSACSNFEENLKDTGDAVQSGAQNAAEAAKQAPADISRALNRIEDDLRD